MFGNNDFIWKFEICSNLLFGKLKIFKFRFELESNSNIVSKAVEIKNLKINT